MKLTTKNVKKFLNDNGACKEGRKALNKLLLQKKSMEFVFNKMKNMRRNEREVSYADWLCGRVDAELYRSGIETPYRYRYDDLTFREFKILFNKLPEA